VAELLVVGVLVAGVVVLTPLAARTGLPQPVLVTMFGLLVPLVPIVPELSIDPHLILPIVLPPLLFAATQRTTEREFRENAGSVLLLAVGLTTATAGAVAVVAHLAGLDWGPAIVLGAIVSPPDPVAATAVARRLKLPHRMVTVLEGEGMFNDATALVTYKVAVAAVVTSEVSAGGIALELVLAVVVGIAVGLAAGWLTRLALSRLHDAAAEMTVTAVMPFAVYLGAEHVMGSGVLAVLALGLYLRTFGHVAITSNGWLLGRAVWGYADFAIASLTFAFVGFELTTVLEDSNTGVSTVWLAVAVVGTLIGFRSLWIFSAVGTARRWPSDHPAIPRYAWGEATVLSWAGMRGVVTVATALALPLTLEDGSDFPRRAELILVALLVVLTTLTVQGLTLSPLVRVLGVGTEADTRREVQELRERAANAGLRTVHGLDPDSTPEVVRRAAELQYEGYLAAQEALGEARAAGPDGRRGHADQLEEVLELAADAEREVVLEARSTGAVSPAAADEVLHDVETRAAREIG
jgi:monovalent cation/hydrogen antiporter